MQQSRSPPCRGGPLTPAAVADEDATETLSQLELPPHRRTRPETERLRPRRTSFPGNRPSFNPTRLHSGQRGMFKGGSCSGSRLRSRRTTSSTLRWRSGCPRP